MTPKELVARLLRSGLCSPTALAGCTEIELDDIEAHVGVRLPEQYKEVMRTIGRSAGDFNSDVDMYYPKVLTLNSRAIRVLSRYEMLLPDRSFVFAICDGGEFLYFHNWRDNSDPPVLHWTPEESESFELVYGSIWEFIEEQLENHERQLSGGFPTSSEY